MAKNIIKRRQSTLAKRTIPAAILLFAGVVMILLIPVVNDVVRNIVYILGPLGFLSFLIGSVLLSFEYRGFSLLAVAAVLFGISAVYDQLRPGDWGIVIPLFLGIGFSVIGLILIIVYFIRKLISRKSEP
jgi:hypothetical protein